MQLKSTVCFSSFVRLVGGSEISGPTSNVKIKNEKLSHYKTIRISQNTAKIVVSAIFAETLQHCNTDLNERLIRLITVKKQQTLKAIE